MISSLFYFWCNLYRFIQTVSILIFVITDTKKVDCVTKESFIKQIEHIPAMREELADIEVYIL